MTLLVGYQEQSDSWRQKANGIAVLHTCFVCEYRHVETRGQLQESALAFRFVRGKVSFCCVHQASWPGGSEDSAASTSHLPVGVLQLQLQDLPWLHPGSGELNWGPFTCPAGTFSTKPSTQPLELIFNVCLQSFNSAEWKEFHRGWWWRVNSKLSVLVLLNCTEE